MTTHGSIGVDGLDISFSSGPEGIVLRGKTIANGSVILSPSNAYFVESQLRDARFAVQRLQQEKRATTPTERELLDLELTAREKMEAANLAEQEAVAEWQSASRKLAAEKKKRRPQPYELTYAYARCEKCGARLAYWPDTRPGEWDCSDVLLGNAPAKDEDGSFHKTYPFAFYNIKSDPSASAPR